MMPDLVSQSTWPKVTFGDVVNYIKDRVPDINICGLTEYIRGEHFEPGNLRLIDRSKLGDGKHGSAFCMRFQPGDVLYVSRNPQLRKAAVADFEGICANTTYVCRANEEYLLQELLPFIMQTESFVEYTIRHKRGSTNFYLNWSDIAEYEFALPPLEEQRRITEVLQAWTAVEDRYRSFLAAASVCKAAVLDELFHPEAARLALSKRNGGPVSDWVRLGELCPLQAGFAFRSAEFSESGDRLLRGSNVAVDATSWDPKKTKSWPTERRDEFEDFLLDEDDVVIAMDRPFIGSGFKVARLTAADLPALLLQRVGRFKPKDETYKELLWAFVHSRSFHVQLLAQQEGTDLPHISKAQIENTLLPANAVHHAELTSLYAQLSELSQRLAERIQATRLAARVNFKAASQ